MSISELLTGQNKTFLQLSVNSTSSNFSFSTNADWNNGWSFLPSSSFAMTPEQLFSGFWLFPINPTNFTFSLPTTSQISDYLLSKDLSLASFIGKSMNIHIINYNVQPGSVATYDPGSWEFGGGTPTIPIQASFRTFRTVRYNEIESRWRID